MQKLAALGLSILLISAGALPASATALPDASVAFTKIANLPGTYSPASTMYNVWGSGQPYDASDDGTYQIAADGYAYNGGNGFNSTGRKVYITSNGGTTWSDSGLPDGEWGPVSVSGDGRYMLAGSYGNNSTVSTADDGKLYRSSNFGATWVDVTPAGGQRFFWDAKISRDGSTMVASSDHTNIPLLSTDSGATWAEIPGFTAGAWRDLAISGDGKVIATCNNDGAGNGLARIFISRSNTRAHTWSTFTESVDRTAGICGSMDMDDSGNLLIAMSWTVEPINIFKYANSAWALDSSVTTTTGAQSTVGWVNGVAISGDGTKIIMGGWDQDNDLISVDGGQTWKVLKISQLATKTGVSTVSRDGTKFYTAATDGFYASSTTPQAQQQQAQQAQQPQQQLNTAPALKGIVGPRSFTVGAAPEVTLVVEDFKTTSTVHLGDKLLTSRLGANSNVTVQLPEGLTPGKYDLVIKTEAGSVRFVDAVRIIPVPPKATTQGLQKRSIVCVKGTSSKTVTGTSPKCPKGFKVKR